MAHTIAVCIGFSIVYFATAPCPCFLTTCMPLQNWQHSFKAFALSIMPHTQNLRSQASTSQNHCAFTMKKCLMLCPDVVERQAACVFLTQHTRHQQSCGGRRLGVFGSMFLCSVAHVHELSARNTCTTRQGVGFFTPSLVNIVFQRILESFQHKIPNL